MYRGTSLEQVRCIRVVIFLAECSYESFREKLPRLNLPVPEFVEIFMSSFSAAAAAAAAQGWTLKAATKRKGSCQSFSGVQIIGKKYYLLLCPRYIFACVSMA